MRVLYVDLEREWRGGQSQALLCVGMTRSYLQGTALPSHKERWLLVSRFTRSDQAHGELSPPIFSVVCSPRNSLNCSMPTNRMR